MTEPINSQGKALGIERPHLRNGSAIANQKMLTYVLITSHFLQRLRIESARTYELLGARIPRRSVTGQATG